MKIHLNIPLNGEEEAWKIEAGRRLLLLNKTGQIGYTITNINLGYYRKGRTTFIFLNNPLVRPSSKTVGIFVWPDSFTTDKGTRFLGVTKNNDGDIEGMYGIFDVGTIIYTREGSEWELTKEGWIQRVIG